MEVVLKRTAKQMFKNLGFECEINTTGDKIWRICYTRKFLNMLGNEITEKIIFRTLYNGYTAFATDKYFNTFSGFYINVPLFKAIQQQMKELG